MNYYIVIIVNVKVGRLGVCLLSLALTDGELVAVKGRARARARAI